MRKYLLLLSLLWSTHLFAQDQVIEETSSVAASQPAFKRNSYVATVAFGFMNSYRSGYSVPAGFEKGTPTGFAPVYARLEYGVSKSVSIAVSTAFNTTYYNSLQIYPSHSGDIKRSVRNKFRIVSGVIIAYKHLGHLLHNDKLDPFIGVGMSLNNIYYSALPQGDSTVERRSHTATPCIKAGVRYFLSDRISAYADAGYDKLSYLSIGFSCRLSKDSD